MHILLCEYELHIPASQSLKDKRSALKSAIARIRNDFNVSIAETDQHDKWQVATVSVVSVAVDRGTLEGVERGVARAFESRGDMQIAGCQMEWL